MADQTLTTSDLDTVRGFLEAVEDLDVERALELCDPDVVYQNVPLPPARGRDEVERQLRWLARYATGFEARIHNIAAGDGVVLTERTDVIAKGRFRAEFWVCGTFELRDGRITLWRDYFDYVDVTVAMLKGAVRAVLPGR